MKVKSQSEVSQSCLTVSDPMDCSPPGSSIDHGVMAAGQGPSVPVNRFDKYQQVVPAAFRLDSRVTLLLGYHAVVYWVHV